MAIIGRVRDQTDNTSPIAALRFSNREETAELLLRLHQEDHNGIIGCPGIIRLQRSAFVSDDQILEPDAMKKFFAELSELARLTESKPRWILTIDDDVSASRLYEFAQLLQGIDPPIEFLILGEE